MSRAALMATGNRFTAAILGGYMFAYGFVAAGTLAAFGLGLRLAEAHMLALMLGILVYLGALLWGFAARSVTRVWLVLGGGGAVMGAAAWALSRLGAP